MDSVTFQIDGVYSAEGIAYLKQQQLKGNTILALDASTVAIGWAVMNFDVVMAHGVKRLDEGKPSFHQRLLAAQYWLGHKLDEYDDLCTVALEQPVLHRSTGKANVETLLHLAYLDGALMGVALDMVSNVLEIRPGERLVALGLPMTLPRDMAKELVRERVNAIFSLGLTAKEHDVSDAVAIGLAAIRRMLKEM